MITTINRLCIQEQCIFRGLFHKDLGLWDGKMGMSLIFFLIFRECQE